MTADEILDLLVRHVGSRDARLITARARRLRARAKELHRAIHEGRI